MAAVKKDIETPEKIETRSSADVQVKFLKTLANAEECIIQGETRSIDSKTFTILEKAGVVERV